MIFRTNSEARFAARLSSLEVNGSISAPFFCDACPTIGEGSEDFIDRAGVLIEFA